MGISFWIDKYLDYLSAEKNASVYTLKDYRYYLNHLQEFLEKDDITLLQNPTLITKYRHHLNDFKKSTKNYFLIALRSFLQYLQSQGVETVNSVEIILDNHPETETEVLDQDSLSKLLSAPDGSSLEGLRDRAIMVLFITAGLKVSELSSLNNDQIDRTKNLITVKSRKVDLTDQAKDQLKLYLEKRKDNFRPLFIRFKGKIDAENFGEKMRLSDRSVERMIEKYTKQLDLNIKATPKTLRHSFAVSKLASGESLKSVQQELGHKSLYSAKRYEGLIQNPVKENTP